MSKKIVVVNYGMSNTLSVFRALEYCGANVSLANTEKEIEKADNLVLPGVGAFHEGMAELKKRNYISPIISHVKKNKPFLGICLGMQMMFESSDEFVFSEGLGIIKGKVIKLPEKREDGTENTIPHISWNKIKQNADNRNDWQKTILHKVKEDSFFYFVHSYYCLPDSNDNILAKTPFYDYDFPSITQKGNVYGVQFHPEKSAEKGLRILNNFISL